MSIKIMNLVWESAPYRGNTLLTLLALADWSSDEGHCFPSLETLAKKSRQSMRSTQYAIEQLSEDQMIVAKLNQGRGSRNEFFINTQKLRVLAGTENMQNATVKHAKYDAKTCKTRHRYKEEPSVEPSGTINPPYPPFSKGGLSDRDRRRISKWVDQLFEDDRRASTQGARSPKRTWSEVLELACADLMLPLDRARRSLCEDDVWRCRLGVESAIGASA